MTQNFTFTLCSPTSHLIFDNVTLATIPSCEGELGIMPQRAPMAMILKQGLVTINNKNDTYKYFVEGGFADISPYEGIVITTGYDTVKELKPEAISDQLKQINHDLEHTTLESERAVLHEKKQILISKLEIFKNLHK